MITAEERRKSWASGGPRKRAGVGDEGREDEQ